MHSLRPLDRSSKFQNVNYQIRGNATVEASRLEAEGHSILKLNTGNPAAFGFEAPHQIVRDVIAAIPSAHGYSDSRGLPAARRAIVARYEETADFPPVDLDDVYLGNGVSELITMTLQALLDPGDEVLIPSPDFPVWSAMTTVAGGTAVHYRCDEEAGWQPNLDDIRAKVTPQSKAIVIINPNNPTGAVYSRETLEGIAEIARQNSLLLLSDEMYDRILFDEAEHIPTASVAPDLLCLTFNGLSKTYRVAGFRSGWLVVTGPKSHARGFIEGLDLLASLRMCASVPSQHAVLAALTGSQSIEHLVAPLGRLREQRDTTWRSLEAIPGVSCFEPQGALYAFPRLDPEVHDIRDDAQLVLDFLAAEHVLLVEGTGFNWPSPDHLRFVMLPEARLMKDAVERFGNFLASYRQ